MRNSKKKIQMIWPVSVSTHIVSLERSRVLRETHSPFVSVIHALTKFNSLQNVSSKVLATTASSVERKQDTLFTSWRWLRWQSSFSSQTHTLPLTLSFKPCRSTSLYRSFARATRTSFPNEIDRNTRWQRRRRRRAHSVCLVLLVYSSRLV